MPYIKSEARIEINSCTDSLSNSIYNPGDMNYAITKLIHNWLIDKHFCYKAINEMIGVLECAKASLIETVLIPYEKNKMTENGNISELDKGYYEKL